VHVRHLDKEVWASGTVEHKSVAVNGVRLHVAEQGKGPLIPPCCDTGAQFVSRACTSTLRLVKSAMSSSL
jgi:hypothetical protein